jgi:hypothetical protein
MSRNAHFKQGYWKQQPLIHTPAELHSIAKSLLDPEHPEIAGHYDDPTTPDNNYLHYLGNNKESAAGECDTACSYAHDHLPHGSHITEYQGETENHFVHHVPTTHGMFVVDYTHRQFNARAKFPVVEPQNKFEARQSMRRFS